jgi:hypothetical protein
MATYVTHIVISKASKNRLVPSVLLRHTAAATDQILNKSKFVQQQQQQQQTADDRVIRIKHGSCKLCYRVGLHDVASTRSDITFLRMI